MDKASIKTKNTQQICTFFIYHYEIKLSMFEVFLSLVYGTYIMQVSMCFIMQVEKSISENFIHIFS